jgi:uncharacterized protein (DUF302 family)/glutaredoxin
MKIALLTSKTCHCVDVEQELKALGFIYERCDVEDSPELVQRFDVRHFPTLIVDEHRVIPIDEDSATRLRQLLTESNTDTQPILNNQVMPMTTKYGFGKTVPMDFDLAIDMVTEALKTEGFSVTTDIDVQATFKEKLDEDILPYRILGACNPSLAHQAFTAEPSLGLLVPCNVVVRQEVNGAVHVEFMNPATVLNLVDNLAIPGLATEVRERLDRVLAVL